ncbi:hypothetical protein niasHT_004944 [Heterodera trifolii]|uniref:Uncharacterized protein n=1 Tax=Heterodera trifolii TaxID=157864 RepID=A0ABD2MAY3_9BILA
MGRGGVCVAVHSEKFRRHIRSSIQHPLSSTAKEFRLRHHFERSFPDAPPTRAPPRLAQQNSRTPCPIDFKFYRPSFHHPQCRTAKEFRLRHHFEPSFPDAPPTRAPPRLAQQNSRTPSERRKNFASGTILSEVFPTPRPLAHPRDLRSKTRAPLVRLTSNFTGLHSTTPNAERRKNFASGTILSEVFPTPRPLAHPRDLRSKTRAPLVRLTSNFTGLHSTTPNAERRKNFASGTILSEVFPTPRPLAHPRDLRSKTRAPFVRSTSNFTGLHSTTPNAERRKNFASGTILSRVFPTPRPLAHPRDSRSKTRAPLVRLTSNFTGLHSTTP